MTPQSKQLQKPTNIEDSVGIRPYSNAAAQASKNKELEDLAKLIQAATGNINNILENSHQFK